MELHGTLSENLRAVFKSVQKFRGKPVYNETLSYWDQLVTHGHKVIRQGNRSPEIAELVRKIGVELSDRHIDRPASEVR